MIAIIYIPHQSPASVEFYNDENHVINAAYSYAENRVDAPEDFDTMGDAIEYLVHDMSRHLVIESAEEIRYVENYQGHQEHRVRGSILSEIRDSFAVPN